VRHGLITTLQIDNRESSETESQGTIYVVPRRHLAHDGQGFASSLLYLPDALALLAEIILPTNPAHQIRSCVKLALTRRSGRDHAHFDSSASNNIGFGARFRIAALPDSTDNQLHVPLASSSGARILACANTLYLPAPCFSLEGMELLTRCIRPFIEIKAKLAEYRINPTLNSPADAPAGRRFSTQHNIEGFPKRHRVEVRRENTDCLFFEGDLKPQLLLGLLLALERGLNRIVISEEHVIGRFQSSR